MHMFFCCLFIFMLLMGREEKRSMVLQNVGAIHYFSTSPHLLRLVNPIY